MNSILKVTLPKEIFHLPLIKDLKNTGALVKTAPDLFTWKAFITLMFSEGISTDICNS